MRCFLRSSLTTVPFPTPEGPIIIKQDIKYPSQSSSLPIIFILKIIMPERLSCEDNELQGWGNLAEAEEEILMLREMIQLLQGYERDCVARLDLGGAKQTRERICRLNGEEEGLRSRVAKARQGQQVLEMSQEQEGLINCFDQCWDTYLNGLVGQLAASEDRLREEQARRKQQLQERFQVEKHNFKPSSRLASLRRKVVGLMKIHSYEEAQFQTQRARALEMEQRQLWEERVEGRFRNACELLQQRSEKEFEVLRGKNESALMKRMNERDLKFSILLKKHQIRCGQASRSHKELLRSISSRSLRRA